MSVEENIAEATSLEDVFDFDGVADDEALTGEDDQSVEAPDTTDANEQPIEIERIEPPEFFSKDHREYFNKLQDLEGGRDYAEQWLNQYTDHQKYIKTKEQEIAERKRDLDTFNQYNQALQPLQDIWRQNAVNPAMGIAQLAHYGQMLNRDPQGLIQEIAKRSGIDLNQLLDEQPYIDPVVDQKIRTLEQQNQQFQQVIGQFQQGMQNQSAQAVQSTIQQFADAVDSTGQPLHPHLDAVHQDMATLLQMPNNGITDLQTAYDAAVKYNPQLQELASKEQAAKRQAEAQKAKEASTKTNSKSKDAPKVKRTLDNLFDGVLDND